MQTKITVWIWSVFVSSMSYSGECPETFGRTSKLTWNYSTKALRRQKRLLQTFPTILFCIYVDRVQGDTRKIHILKSCPIKNLLQKICILIKIRDSSHLECEINKNKDISRKTLGIFWVNSVKIFVQIFLFFSTLPCLINSLLSWFLILLESIITFYLGLFIICSYNSSKLCFGILID